MMLQTSWGIDDQMLLSTGCCSCLWTNVGNGVRTPAFFILDDIPSSGRAQKGWMTLKETRTLENLTTCKECLTLTLSVPKECRMNIDLLSARLEELFNREVFRDLCYGCPLEKK